MSNPDFFQLMCIGNWHYNIRKKDDSTERPPNQLAESRPTSSEKSPEKFDKIYNVLMSNHKYGAFYSGLEFFKT